MSLWEMAAAVGGYAKANGADEATITTEEAAALADLIDRPPVWH